MRSVIIDHVVGDDAEAVLPNQTREGIILHHHLCILRVGISETSFVFQKLQHIGQTHRGGDGGFLLIRVTKGVEGNAPGGLNQIGVIPSHKCSEVDRIGTAGLVVKGNPAIHIRFFLQQGAIGDKAKPRLQRSNEFRGAEVGQIGATRQPICRILQLTLRPYLFSFNGVCTSCLKKTNAFAKTAADGIGVGFVVVPGFVSNAKLQFFAGLVVFIQRQIQAMSQGIHGKSELLF